MNVSDKYKMLYARAGFGMPLKKGEEAFDITVQHLVHPPAPQPLELITAEEWAENNPKMLKASAMTEEERKMKRKTFRERRGELNTLWLNEMVHTDHPLREKMALFWHGHFATRIDNPYFDQLLLQDIRTHALGKFSDLLLAVSKSPAMLQFLNNQQNKKQHPNENFAREVMELFTLGRGHYTEGDIKEAARAFTGWGYDEAGEFTFRVKQHDTGSKTVLGKTGNLHGDDVLTILLEQKQTAIFLTEKIYRFFVNEEYIDAKRVQALAGAFYESGYDIAGLMQNIFTSDWFYSSRNTGAHIKSPVELLAGIQRMIPMQFETDKTLINLQRVLGQELFYPPNVAGWAGGKNWIDSSSLVIRMRLPEAFFASRELNLRAKEQDAEMMEVNKKPVGQDSGKEGHFKVGKAAADWSAYLDFWKGAGSEDLPRLMADHLLPTPVTAEQLVHVARFTDNSSPENRIKSLTILLMALPEYQLC